LVAIVQNTKYQHNLELTLNGAQADKTFTQHQYTTYPLRLSTPFYLEGVKSQRAYYYLINTSPGLLAGDQLSLSLQLGTYSQLYLTDQAATKVHPMPDIGKGRINYQITVEANASLELCPEPIILYQDAILEQNTVIELHQGAKLWQQEIILPGRLAKNEYYDFSYYLNRLHVQDAAERLLFADATRLIGKQNQFKRHRLFASLPIMGNAIAVLPEIEPDQLIDQLEKLELSNSDNLEVAISTLPNINGIIIRALSDKTGRLKQYFSLALGCIRSLTDQSPLPHIPK